jgi:hypothetical protein
MSDTRLRDTERRWRETGHADDGSAYVQAAMRATGEPIVPILTMLVRQDRALRALDDALQEGLVGHRLSHRMRGALLKPITPDDMVAYLRGDGEWGRGLLPDSTVDVSAVRPHGDPIQAHAARARAAERRIREWAPDERAPMCGIVGPAASQQDGGCVLPRGHDGQHMTRQNEEFCQHDQRHTCGRCDSSIDPADPNANVPRRNGGFDPDHCEHANEAPSHCPCPSGCTCRHNGHTCSDVTAVHAMSDRECQYCNLDAWWCFKTLGGPYVCEQHLVSERATRFRHALGRVMEQRAQEST